MVSDGSKIKAVRDKQEKKAGVMLYENLLGGHPTPLY
jgi:hypothetical protein